MPSPSKPSLPVMIQLRAAILVLFGSPVVAALLAGTLTWTFETWRLEVPLSSSDRLGAWLFGGLSAVVLAVLLRASFRVWKGGRSLNPLLTAVVWVAPLTILAGLSAGAVIASQIVGDHHLSLKAEAVRDCAIARQVTGVAGSEAKCLQAARTCGQLRVENPAGLPQPDLEVLGKMPDRFREKSGLFRKEAYCLLQAMGGME